MDLESNNENEKKKKEERTKGKRYSFFSSTLLITNKVIVIIARSNWPINFFQIVIGKKKRKNFSILLKFSKYFIR